jgi:Fe2+ transport system protein FeoA
VRGILIAQFLDGQARAMVAPKKHSHTVRHLSVVGRRLWLYFVTKGSNLTIVDIPAGKSREQLIRLGIMKGENIRCVERLPGGTVVIEKNRRELAIGAALAKTILVERASDNPTA